jgi:hypothetical protein
MDGDDAVEGEDETGLGGDFGIHHADQEFAAGNYAAWAVPFPPMTHK